MVSTRGTPAQGTPHHEVFGAKQRGHPSLEFTLTGFCIELWLYVKLAFLRYQVYQYLDSNIISILTLTFLIVAFNAVAKFQVLFSKLPLGLPPYPPTNRTQFIDGPSQTVSYSRVPMLKLKPCFPIYLDLGPFQLDIS